MASESRHQRKLQTNKLRRERHILAGLCTHCKKPAAPNRKLCKKHLQQGSEKTMRYADRKKAAGLCSKCGIKPLANKTYCEECRLISNAYNAISEARNRSEVFNHYGRACQCCGEKELVFLTIDHINDDGAEHRKKTGPNTYSVLRAAFRRTGKWPDGIRILCYNCNAGRWRNGGECPHVAQKVKE